MKPREWSLPLNTLIINSDFNRPNGIHVIGKSAYDRVSERLRVLGDYAKSILEKYPAECAHGNGYSLLGQLAQQVATEAQILDPCVEDK